LPWNTTYGISLARPVTKESARHAWHLQQVTRMQRSGLAGILFLVNTLITTPYIMMAARQVMGRH
jgi:hypothetical protein